MGDTGGIPAREVERCQACAVVEHTAHVGDTAGVPVREVERCQPFAVVEHSAHVSDTGGVDVAQIYACAVNIILKQVRAIASKTHLFGGCDTGDLRFSHFIAPLVIITKLTGDEYQLTCRVVVVVARSNSSMYNNIGSGHP